MEVDQYETQSYETGHIFIFISRGLHKIVKLVRYNEINITYNKGDNEQYKAFNLGFGNKKEGSFEIDDLARSNNGDMYLVFNTVLQTIPIFFKKNKYSAIHVMGSDEIRHLAYHRFINQRYVDLILEFEFYGSLDGQVCIYEIGTIYDYIVILLKMH